MIEAIPHQPDGTLAFRLFGTVTEDDYISTLVPAIEQALQDHDRIRLLVRVESHFEKITAGAAKEDALLGLRHWNGFDRVAVVTDTGWLASAVRGFAFMMPCPVRTFDLDEFEAAQRWLSESLGSIHQTDLGSGVLHLQMLGQVDAAAYEREVGDLDAFIRRNDRFRLLLDLTQFDGWLGLSAIGEHFKLVRDHRQLVERLAIVGNRRWQKMAERIGRQLLGVDARYFDEADLGAAKAWIAA